MWQKRLQIRKISNWVKYVSVIAINPSQIPVSIDWEVWRLSPHAARKPLFPAPWCWQGPGLLYMRVTDQAEVSPPLTSGTNTNISPTLTHTDFLVSTSHALCQSLTDNCWAPTHALGDPTSLLVLSKQEHNKVTMYLVKVTCLIFKLSPWNLVIRIMYF